MLTPAWAEKADRDKPMNVLADALKHDDLKQISQFTGHVVLTKGTLIIHADRIDVRQDAQGYQYGTATTQAGRKATFRQKRDKPDEWVEGEAEMLVYNGKADVIELHRSAQVRRLRGAQLSDESTGHFISYDNTTETFMVEGGKTATEPGGRVRAVLTPQSAWNNTSKPTEPVTGTPGSGLSAPAAADSAAAFRNSSQLDLRKP